MSWPALVLALSSFTSIHGESCTVAGDIRLAHTSSIRLTNAGRVEICVGGVWGTIAADAVGTPWSEKNAQVACIQARFDGALNSIFQRTLPFVERSTSPIHLTTVRCTGIEPRIIDCPHSNSTENVDHGFDAYIVCRPKSFRYSVVHPANGPQSGDIRLFGDVRDGHGAVQIYTVTLGWQGICPDSSWTDGDAATICQDLGYRSGSIAAPVTATSGPDGLPTSRQLYGANCPGSSTDEVTTGVCSFRVQRSRDNCAFPEGTFAAIQCSPVVDQSVRLIGGSHFQEGIVEIAYNGRWGMMCNIGFSNTDAKSICQGLGFGTDDAKIMSLSSSSSVLDAESNLRPIWLTELGCTSSDSNLPACVLEENIIGYTDCQNSSIAAVDCGDPPPLTPGQTAGVVIGVLTFVAIAVPLLVICLDENKKKATLAKLSAFRSRLSKIQLPCPRPRPQRQRPRSTTPARELATVAEPPAPEPAAAAVPEPQRLHTEPEPEAPPVAEKPLVYPELSTTNDEPPPYPGGPGPAYPPQFAVTTDYQGYPPPWTHSAYPPPSEVSNCVPYPDN